MSEGAQTFEQMMALARGMQRDFRSSVTEIRVRVEGRNGAGESVMVQEFVLALPVDPESIK
jgi:hypothetical protein